MLPTKKTMKTVFYHLFLISFGLLMIYPVLWMISGSFKDNVDILSGSLNIIPTEFKWENYVNGWRGFGGITFTTFFKNSFIITTASTLGTVLSSALIAYAFT